MTTGMKQTTMTAACMAAMACPPLGPESLLMTRML
jgi:hypothetical protein